MNVHIVGIGGIGVSALARYYLAKGWKVSGSDLTASEITKALEKLGASIAIGPHVKSNVPSIIDLLIFSPAVSRSNPELKEAMPQNVQIMSYPEALGELTKSFITIAVSGTHGKSTTSSMIGLLLERAGLDPTVVIGTKLKEFGNSNFRIGKGKYLVIEADEHFASFLHYHPSIIVLTTVEEDHLDYYKNINHIISTFRKYISRLPKQGALIANRDDKNIQKIVKKNAVLWYSLKQREAGKISQVIGIPGTHNVSNGLAVLTVARALGIKDSVVYKTLSRYRGSWRRFEVFNIKKPKPFTLVSDYGHHPTEIRVTVEAARAKWPDKKLWLVFQPHQYQRTYYLWKKFIRTLSHLPVDTLILLDIYDVAGREEKPTREKISSSRLADEINKTYPLKRIRKKALHIPTIFSVQQYLKRYLGGGEVVMVMGAGNIYDLTLHLTKKGKREKI